MATERMDYTEAECFPVRCERGCLSRYPYLPMMCPTPGCGSTTFVRIGEKPNRVAEPPKKLRRSARVA